VPPAFHCEFKGQLSGDCNRAAHVVFVACKDNYGGEAIDESIPHNAVLIPRRRVCLTSENHVGQKLRFITVQVIEQTTKNVAERYAALMLPEGRRADDVGGEMHVTYHSVNIRISACSFARTQSVHRHAHSNVAAGAQARAVDCKAAAEELRGKSDSVKFFEGIILMTLCGKRDADVAMRFV
jgi:hypothetical protein